VDSKTVTWFGRWKNESTKDLYNEHMAAQTKAAVGMSAAGYVVHLAGHHGSRGGGYKQHTTTRRRQLASTGRSAIPQYSAAKTKSLKSLPKSTFPCLN
jgi:hypothetical protein